MQRYLNMLNLKGVKQMFEQRKSDTYKKSFCVGRIADFSDLCTDSNGMQYIKFSVAVNQNKDKPDFFNYIAYNSKARKIERYISEGMKKFVVFGTDVTGSYKDKHGTKHKTNTTVCLDIFPVDKNSANEIIVSLESIFKSIEADRIFSFIRM